MVAMLVAAASIAQSIGAAQAASGPTEWDSFMYGDGHATSTVGAAHRLVSGLASGSGSTVGPDGALYVTEGATGRIVRVDPATGDVSTFMSGLPAQLIPLGGAMDVAFIDDTAYVLVTLVGAQFGGTSVVGIYRVDDPTSAHAIADIGSWAEAHPPVADIFIPTGLQYAMQPYGDGFLVTDGHHNRVYRVTLDGIVSDVIAFGDVVPTGLAMAGDRVFMAEAGPVPHLPQDGRVISFDPSSPDPTAVAAGGRLLVDVELDGSGDLFALAQGVFPADGEPGSPANPNTGQLLRADQTGTFSVLADGLNQPTSMELIDGNAYVVTLGGEVWVIDDVAGAVVDD
jgi:sugar lactone lactonase YvrE